MKNGHYFKHDVTASGNQKLMLLMEKEGAKGYGFYWLLIEMLSRQPNLRAPMDLLSPLAYRFRTKAKNLRRLVEDYDLFVVDGGSFRSPGLDKRMKPFIEAQKACISPLLVDQDSRNSLKYSPNMRDNARTEEKSRKENSNRSEKREIVAAKKLPVAPIRPWESLADEMTADTFWMELVGMRSGLGQLYIDHRAEVVELFRQHIRLYDKGGGLLRLQDVKQYFANYLAAGSRTCQGVRELLLDDIRRRQASAGGSRYETIVDGRRTYLGRSIPDDAPPRPDEFSVWDEEKKKWTR